MPPAVYHFGNFELIPSRFELRRDGRIVKLERIPMDLLILLAERDGDVVTRSEIVDRLWGRDVFVDTEHGINTAARKIRAALGEDADQPRFVFTVPGKGYRLAVDRADAPAGVVSREETAVAAPSAAAHPVPSSVGERRRRWLPFAAAAGILALVGAAFVVHLESITKRTPARPGATAIRSIAVLPLVNLSSDEAQEYFADGMTDELITTLAKRTSLRVISHTSVSQYKRAPRPLPDIARELGVDSILEGSVTKSGSGVHMRLQLIEASTDTHLWADSFDRDLESAYALCSSLADTIGRVVGAATTNTADRRVSPEAHDAYLHGRYFWFVDDYDRSQQYLEKAIQIQPDYALAWSGLADVYAVRAVAGLAPPEGVMAQARAANARALALDDSLPEAHVTLGAVHLFYEWDFPRAEAELNRAIEAKPNYTEAHHLRSYVMIAMNRPVDALQEQKRSTELDPFERPWALGFVLMHLRQFDAAVAELRLRKAAQPGDRFTIWALATCYEYKHMEKEAAAELAEASRLFGDAQDGTAILQAFASGGARAVAEHRLRKIEASSRRTYVSPLELAHAHARLQHREQTLALLEAAARVRSSFLIFLQTEPDFDFLHGDRRYEAVVKRIGLAPAPALTH
jgi:TolB-like protein/DNA-binding winged helix-turn-helix (wHTH) protein